MGVTRKTNESIVTADLGLTTCLVVEDQSAILALLSDVLKVLNVGRVLPVASVRAAIDMIEQVQRNPTSVGISNIDFAVIDWNLNTSGYRSLNSRGSGNAHADKSNSGHSGTDAQAENKTQINAEAAPLLEAKSVDGMQGVDLARWIRQNEGTVFMPILGVSAYCNIQVVRQIRDAGINSFISKPFSVAGVARHIQRIVQDVKPHIITPSNYFGPERRRHAHPVETECRRSQAGVKLFNPPRALRNKTSGSANLEESEVSAIMQRMQDIAPADFLVFVDEKLATIESFLSGINPDATSTGDSQENARLYQEIDYLCNEILGHYGCFSYQMLAQAISSICRFMGDPHFIPNQRAYSLIMQQVATVKVISMKKMKGVATPEMLQVFATSSNVMNKMLVKNREFIESGTSS